MTLLEFVSQQFSFPFITKVIRHYYLMANNLCTLVFKVTVWFSSGRYSKGTICKT